MIEKRTLIHALAVHGGPIAAARALNVDRRLVHRWMLKHGLVMAREKRVQSVEAWRGLYEQHQASVRAIARALGMSDHRYVARQLERLWIKPMPDAWLESQDAAA